MSSFEGEYTARAANAVPPLWRASRLPRHNDVPPVTRRGLGLARFLKRNPMALRLQ